MLSRINLKSRSLNDCANNEICWHRRAFGASGQWRKAQKILGDTLYLGHEVSGYSTARMRGRFNVVSQLT
jgi:hypothetical protein